MNILRILFVSIIACILVSCKDDGETKEYIYVSSSTLIGKNTQDTIKMFITSGYSILEGNMKSPQIYQDNGIVYSFNYKYETPKHQVVDISFLVDKNNNNDIYYDWKFGNGTTTKVRIARNGKNNNANYFSDK